MTRAVSLPIYEKQRRFLVSQKRFRGFVGGRGCGKSEVGAIAAISYAQTQKKRRLYMVAAPTVQSLHDYTIRSFKKVATALGVWDDRTFRSGDAPSWSAPFGDFIFRSAHKPDNLRGPNLGGMWMDEASLYHPDAFANALACVRDGDHLGGITATFTPKGRTHWTYSLFGSPPSHCEEWETDSTYLVRATSLENPFLSPSFYTDLVKIHGRHSRQAKQELGGQFLDPEGAEWPGHLFDHDRFAFRQWPHRSEWDICVIACDPSKGSDAGDGDYSAIVVLVRTKDGDMYVRANMDNRRSAEEICDALLEEYLWACGSDAEGTCQPHAVAIETNVFQHLMSVILRKKAAERGVILPVVELNNRVKKEVRIRRCGPYLERKQFRFKANCFSTQLLVAQLQEFPAADHDDGPDALEMALRTAIEVSVRRAKRKAEGPSGLVA